MLDDVDLVICKFIWCYCLFNDFILLLIKKSQPVGWDFFIR